ncbi:hypothetical protein M8494_03900 [Serratia ureilytica]
MVTKRGSGDEITPKGFQSNHAGGIRRYQRRPTGGGASGASRPPASWCRAAPSIARRSGGNGHLRPPRSVRGHRAPCRSPKR